MSSTRLLCHNAWENGKEGWSRENSLSAFYASCAAEIMCLQEYAVEDQLSEVLRSEGYEIVTETTEATSLSIISKCKVVDHRLIDDRALFASLRIDGQRVSVYNLHLPFHPLHDTKRLEVLRACIAHSEQHTTDFTIFCGDFNSLRDGDQALAWNKDFIARRAGINGPLARDDWKAAVSFLLSNGYVDLYRQFSRAEGFTYQAPTYKFFDMPGLTDLLEIARGFEGPVISSQDARINQFEKPGMRLDYVFADPRLASKTITGAIMEDAAKLSDHLPILVEFSKLSDSD